LRLSLVHSLGRLATYVALGALAGLVGSAIDLAGSLGNIQRAATIVGAAVIVAIAVVPLVTRRRAPARSPFTAALVRIKSRSEVRRAWLIGTLTGLLPCGWLWAFVVMAAGTASAAGGALVMATFWLGTAPAMIGVVRVAGPLIARMRARMPAITAIVLIAAGLGTLAMRWQDAGTAQVRAPHCHCQGGAS
jgi:sulfite exporter TauE/SafE